MDGRKSDDWEQGRPAGTSQGDPSRGSVAVGEEQRFEFLAEAVGACALFLLDAGGSIATWNLGARHLVGWAAPEIVGNHFSVLYPQADQEARLPEQHLDAAVKRGTFEGDGWWVTKDGDRKWTAVLIVALRHADRRPLGFAVVARDAFGDTDRLAKANEELVRADTLRTQFLAATAHELAAPVTAIGGLAKMLDDSGAGMDDETRQRVLRAIRLQTAGLDRRVRDLVTASNLDAGGTVPIHLEEVGVEEVIASAVAGFPDRAPEISYDCPSALRAHADGDRVHQILTNYLRNALRYGAPPITVRASQVGDGVEIRVCDAGPGVAPAFIGRLFHRFQRDEATASSIHGTGLGLFIVQGLAAAMHGHAWYEPNQPQGSCFGVTVPLAQPDGDA